MGINLNSLSPHQLSLIDPSQKKSLKIISTAKNNPEIIEQRNFAIACKARGWRHLWHNTAKPSTANVGAPDFVVAARNHTFWIEFKRPNQNLRPDQAAFHKQLRQNGVSPAIVHSALEAVNLIETFHSKT
jgi:hypothetical protein